jgi:hypothetical protein
MNHPAGFFRRDISFETNNEKHEKNAAVAYMYVFAVRCFCAAAFTGNSKKKLCKAAATQQLQK